MRRALAAWPIPNDRLQRYHIVERDAPGRGHTVIAMNIRSREVAQRIVDLWNGTLCQSDGDIAAGSIEIKGRT